MIYLIYCVYTYDAIICIEMYNIDRNIYHGEWATRFCGL